MPNFPLGAAIWVDGFCLGTVFCRVAIVWLLPSSFVGIGTNEYVLVPECDLQTEYG